MTIFNTLTKHFGPNYKNYKGDIGLEIETEAVDEYLIPKFSFWDGHQDNSLRNFGREYVLRQPLDFEVTFPKALEEFADKTKDIKFIQDSITTSVHTHLNLLNDNFVTLGNFVTTYTLTENLLIRFSGEDRRSNLFCLPICDAEEIYNNIMRMLEGIRNKKYGNMGFDAESTKYGALNLSSLSHFGSLEIRSFRGTTDTKLIHQWVGILYSILKFSRSPGLVPPMIIHGYRDRGVEYLGDIFGEYRKFLRHPSEEELVEKNFWYAANMAYSIKDWSKLEDIEKPKRPKAKDLDKIAMSIYGQKFEELNHQNQRAILRSEGLEVAEPTEGEVTEEGVRFRELYDRVTAPRNTATGITLGDMPMYTAGAAPVRRTDWTAAAARATPIVTAPATPHVPREEPLRYNPMDGFIMRMNLDDWWDADERRHREGRQIPDDIPENIWHDNAGIVDDINTALEVLRNEMEEDMGFDDEEFNPGGTT